MITVAEQSSTIGLDRADSQSREISEYYNALWVVTSTSDKSQVKVAVNPIVNPRSALSLHG